MGQTVGDIMTSPPLCVTTATSLQVVATEMRDKAMGTVVVTERNELVGLVTDRDLVVRGLATGALPGTPVGEMCSERVVSIDALEPLEAAVRLMRRHAVRRLPVVHDGALVGVISIGDLAIEIDESSALATISAAPANG